MHVTAPDGVRWTISRRWLPWRPRRRRVSRDHVEDAVSDLSLADEPAVLLLVGTVGLLLVALPVLLVAGILAVEIALVLLLLPVVTVGRALLVGRWPFVTWRGEQLAGAESVRGWRASSRRMREVARAIERGEHPAGGVASS